MFHKVEVEKASTQQEIYLSLLNKYEKALYALGKTEDEVNKELAEYIQFYNIFA